MTGEVPQPFDQPTYEGQAAPWEHILVLRNPYSSNQASIARHLKQLVKYSLRRKNGPEIEITKTEPDLTGNIELLRAKAQPKSLIDVCGGDGTFNLAARALLETRTAEAITTRGGGNANNHANMLHDALTQAHAPWFLETGMKAGLTPLKITAEHPNLAPDDERRELLPTAYFSIGFTAVMAEQFNAESWRKQTANMSRTQRLLMESAATWRNYRQANTFTLYDHDEESPRDLTELCFPNGRLMAKILRFRGLDLLEQRAGRLELGQPTVPRLAWALGRAATSQFVKFGPETIQSFTVEAKHDIVAQADGEAYVYPSGTSFTVGFADRPVPVVTTRQPAQFPIAA
jgi:diacylglycerol kinase family enzyme